MPRDGENREGMMAPDEAAQQRMSRPAVASQLLARVRGQSSATSVTNVIATLKPEPLALVRSLLSEILELLPRFRLMESKAEVLRMRLEALNADLETIFAPESTANALQLESVMHALLESIRNVVEHETPCKLVLAFFLLDAERANMNMHLQTLAAAVGNGLSPETLQDLMSKVTDADAKDLDQDSQHFREALRELQEDGERATLAMQEVQEAEAEAEEMASAKEQDGTQDHDASGEQNGTSLPQKDENQDKDQRLAKVDDYLCRRRQRLGRLATTLLTELERSDFPQPMTAFEMQRRDAQQGLVGAGRLFVSGQGQGQGQNRRRESRTAVEGNETTGAADEADQEDSSINAEARRPFPALFIQRPNINVICTHLAQVVKQVNAILDAEVSLDMPFKPETEISGAHKVRLGSKICFVERNRDGDQMLSFRPFSRVNRSGTDALMYDSLSARSRAEIRRELALWSSLDSKNVLHIEGAIFALNSMAVVMEPADLTLFDFLYKEGQFPQGKELEAMMRGLTRGLAHLHKNNIVHRQLSPHNILLSYERGLRITGFGFGWVESSVRESVQIQYAYMAPELLRVGVPSTRRLSFSSDVYAASMLLYEMAHHKRPFAGASYNEVFQMVETARARPICEHDVTLAVGAWFPVVLAQSWQDDAAKRPSAATLFATVRNNTRASARSSGRVMQSMLSFLPRRNAGSPRPALELLSRPGVEPKEVYRALSQLFELAVKQARSGRRRHRVQPVSRAPSQNKMLRAIARTSKKRLPALGAASAAEAAAEADWQGLLADEDEDDEMSSELSEAGDASRSGRGALRGAQAGNVSTTGNGEWFFSRLWDLEGGRTILTHLEEHEEDGPIAKVCLRLLRIVGRSQFEPYFSDRQDALVQMGAVERIVSTMNTHEEDVDVLAEAAGALRSLASAGDDMLLNDARRMRMVDSEALATVLRAMEAHPDAFALQFNGVGLVRNVSFSEEVINTAVMEDAVALVVRATNKHKSPTLTRNAIATLSNLSFAPGNQERLLDEPQAVEELVKAIASNGSDARLLAAAFLTLWNLLFSDPSLAIQLQNLGVVELVRVALRRFPQDTHLISNMLSLVDSMAWTPEVREYLVECGMIGAVEDALGLQTDTQEVWEAGVSALKSLSWSSLEPLHELDMTEFIFAKTTSLYLLNLDILRNALLLLQNLTCVEENLVPLAQCGAADWVLRSMGAHPKDSIVAEAGSGALCNLATPDENKEVVYKTGVVAVLQRTLRIHTDSETISRNTACAIVRLARTPEIYESMDRDALAGPLKGVLHRFPDLADFPDLQDLEELFPVDSALLDRCSICLEELFVDQTSMPYTCEHCFHLHCVGKWASINKTCPLCRSPLNDSFEMPDDISEVDPRYEEDEALLAPFLNENNSNGDDNSNRGGERIVMRSGRTMLRTQAEEWRQAPASDGVARLLALARLQRPASVGAAPAMDEIDVVESAQAELEDEDNEDDEEEDVEEDDDVDDDEEEEEEQEQEMEEAEANDNAQEGAQVAPSPAPTNERSSLRRSHRSLRRSRGNSRRSRGNSRHSSNVNEDTSDDDGETTSVSAFSASLSAVAAASSRAVDGDTQADPDEDEDRRRPDVWSA